MNCASFDECLENNLAKRITPDKGRAASLRETAQARLLLIKGIDLGNCNFVFEDCYTSLLEEIHALVLEEGFGVSNHLCLGLYLRDVLKRGDLYALFDDVRKKRNSLTYYGVRMELGVAKDAIAKCKRLIHELKTVSRG